MPEDLLALCPPDAKVVDTGPLTLDQIIAELADADAAGLDVARLHSGDPSIYSALAEQCRRLDALGIDYEIVPGVPAFAAAAAVLGRELTVPGVAQTVTLTRVATLSTAMPPGEDLKTLSAPAARWSCIWRRRRSTRSCRNCSPAATGPKPHVPSWRSPAGRRRRWCGARCAELAEQMQAAGVTRTAVIVVGDVLAAEGFQRQLPVFVGPGASGTALMAQMRILLLGGTAEARALAARLHPDVDVISSLAGRVPDPALPVGEVRIGGFGGDRRNAALAGRRTCRRGGRRHSSLRRHDHRQRRGGVR